MSLRPGFCFFSSSSSSFASNSASPSSSSSSSSSCSSPLSSFLQPQLPSSSYFGAQASSPRPLSLSQPRRRPGNGRQRRKQAYIATFLSGALAGTQLLLPPASADLLDEVSLEETCSSCLEKGLGWCTTEQRCVEDDPEYCDVEHLIGLAGFTDDCRTDPESGRARVRPSIDKGVLVQYNHENGSCCLGLGIVHRTYQVLEEYTVLLPNSSVEEVKTEAWNKRKPAKKKDQNSEYHNMQFRYFRKQDLGVLSGIRPGDLVEAHFAVKTRKTSQLPDENPGQEALVKSKRTEMAVVVNTTIDTIALNYTTDHIVSVVPRSFVIDPTNGTRPGEKPSHEEL